MNTCGGGAAANKAVRLSRTTPTFTYNEYMIDQCCPTGSGGQSNPWFAQKSCPNTGSGAQPSTCGTTGATAACKSCAGYPVNSGSFCDISVASSTSDRYCYNEASVNLTFTLAAGAGPTTGSAQHDGGRSGSYLPGCAVARHLHHRRLHRPRRER